MADEHEPQMDEWEKELFGGYQRKWWAGAEVHKLGSINDKPEIKPGTPIFEANDPPTEAARKAWDQTRIRDPEAERRFQDEFYLDLHGGSHLTPKQKALQEIMGKIADIFTPPSKQEREDREAIEALKKKPNDYTFGVDVSSKPDASVLSVTTPSDNGTVPTVRNTTLTGADGSANFGLFNKMNEPGEPSGFMQVGSDSLKQLEVLQCHLTEPSMRDDLGGGMIDYDLLHAEGMKRTTGRLGWQSDAAFILAVHETSSEYLIGHIPTGCLLHYPGFTSMATALFVCDQLGRFFSQYINTRDTRRLLDLFGDSAAWGAAARWFQHILDTDETVGWTKWYLENER